MIGSLKWAEITAPALAGNPLGDPIRRSILFYLPPGHDVPGKQFPAAYFLHGFGGSVHGWTQAALFAPTVLERLDALVASGAVPPTVGVFVDGATSLGGTQWIDAAAVGRYQTYVAEDVVAFADARLRTIPRRESRAVIGKSSGGYGALAMAKDRSDVFAHVASHAGDAGFEYAYLPDFPRTAAALLDTDPGTWLAGLKERARDSKLRGDDHPVLNVLAMAAHYSPAPGRPLGLELPFDPGTARLRGEVWARWLAHDPARFVPAAIERFRTLGTVFLDCGSRDEFNLRWGARQVAEALRAGGVEVLHEEFDDGHRGIDYRYARSLSYVLPRLARD
jgi:S-formylglutathione hydrolase FrmB